jgi:hypothetical protein
MLNRIETDVQRMVFSPLASALNDCRETNSDPSCQIAADVIVLDRGLRVGVSSMPLNGAHVALLALFMAWSLGS